MLAKEKSEYSLNERMFFSLVRFKEVTIHSVATIIGIAILVSLGLLVLELQQFFGHYVVFPLIAYSILALGIIYGYRLELRRKEIHNILDEYVRQNYYFSFETLKPEGKDSIEKFMSLARDVFPPIKFKFEKEGSDFVSDISKKDSFNITLKTDEGMFLLKHFSNEVKFSDIENVVQSAASMYGKKILRLVCLSNKFDDLFFEEGLNEKMEKLQRNFNLDLIIEREKGYSVIWID